MRLLAFTAVNCLFTLLFPFRVAYGQSNNLMLPIGHTGRVYTAVYSPATANDPLGGKFILTASNDKTMMLWSATDGKLIRIYKGHTESVKCADFSSDGKQIVSGSEDGTLKEWNIETGKIEQSLDDIKDEVQWLALSPLYGKNGNSKTVIICCRTTVASIRKMDNPSFSLPLTNPTRIRAASFSPDGKYFVTVAVDDPEIGIWDAEKGLLIKKMEVAREAAITASFSLDGQSIIVSSIDDRVSKWDIKTGKKLMEIKAAVPEVLSVCMSKDGKYIATCSAGGIARLFDAKTGDKLKEWQSGDQQQTFRGVASISFSPDASYVLTLSGYNNIKTWLAETSELVSDIRNHTSIVSYTSYSPSGNLINTIHEDGSMRTWNATNGRLLSLAHRRYNYTSAGYSPANTSMGSKYFSYSTEDSIACYYFRDSGAERQLLIGHHGKVNSIAFSPDGNSIVTSSNDSTAIIWKVVQKGNGQILHVLKGHKAFVVAANYSPDGKHIITSSYDRSAMIWNAASGALEKILTNHSKQVISARYSPDSKKIITTCWDDTVRIWDASSYKLLASIQHEDGVISDASFSPRTVDDSLGGKNILTCGPGNKAIIWDATTGKKLMELTDHTDLVTSATYSPNGKYIVTSSYDNFCKIWDAGNAKPLYSFIAVDSAEYLITDEFGRFDGSTSGRKMMYLTCGTEIVELDQFKDLAWEPGLAAKLLGNNKEPITAKNINDLNVCQFTPEVITLPLEKNMYHFRIIPRRGGLGNIELYVNSKLVKTVDTTGLARDKGSFLYSFNASEIADYFVAGESNEVEVKANTAEGNISSRGVTIIKSAVKRPGDLPRPNLYIVSIGISLYKGEVLKLNYASKDAADFANALEAAGKNLLNKEDDTDHVFTYTLNTEPGNIEWPLKNKIHETLDSVASKATSNDIIVIFFAGHGVLPAGQKSLYLLTAEATSFDLPEGLEKQVAISTDELIDWMKTIKAGKQVLILDACNSGQVIQNIQSLIGRGEIPADQQRALQNLQDKSGTYILSASASGQSAYESGVYNQGLLTYSLLSGLKLGDGLRATEYVDLSLWFNSAANNVQVLAQDIGGRQNPQIFGNTSSFDVGKMDKKQQENIVLPAKKKVFGESLLIGNLDYLNDSLGLSQIVDKELLNRNSRGKESQLAFSPNSKTQDTYYIKGRYSISGTQVNVSYLLFEDQQKLKSFTSTILLADIASLGIKVAEELERYFSARQQQ